MLKSTSCTNNKGNLNPMPPNGLRSAWTLKRTAFDRAGATEYWQAGRSVATIHEIVPAARIVHECAAALRVADLGQEEP